MFIYTLLKSLFFQKVTSGPLDIALHQMRFILIPWLNVNNALHAGDSEISIITGTFACTSGMHMLFSLLRHNSLYPVTVYISIWEAFSSNFGWNTSWFDWSFREFFQSLQANIGTVAQLRHDRFLPNNFHFIIHLSSYHWKPRSLAAGSVIK
jgi:hypothetical protein